MIQWIWQHKNWPKFVWDDAKLTTHLAKARLAQGRLMGIIEQINKVTMTKLDSIMLAAQALDTSAIEGEILNRDSVRSSIATRLGLEHGGISQPKDRYIEGLLDMLLDATTNYQAPLTLQRLYGWHAALFPTGYSGIHKITVAALRKPSPMEIVSGPFGKEVVHYIAPQAQVVKKNINAFLAWFNHNNKQDGLIRAGVAHLWFELIHPFEDGNGRIGRAIIDLALAQDEKQSSRYYSLSSAIMQDRKSYYAQLEKSCRGNLDITAWLSWFLDCFAKAIHNSMTVIDTVNLKSKFWQKHATTELNQRQMKALNRLLDAGEAGFSGGMTTKKYTHLTKVSRATAYRELNDLVNKRCLRAKKTKGRSAAYELAHPEQTQT